MNAPTQAERLHPTSREAAEALIDQVNETHDVADIHGSAVHQELAVILTPAPNEWNDLPARGSVVVYVPWPGLTLNELQDYRAGWGLSPEVSVWSHRWHVSAFVHFARGVASVFRTQTARWQAKRDDRAERQAWLEVVDARRAWRVARGGCCAGGC